MLTRWSMPPERWCGRLSSCPAEPELPEEVAGREARRAALMRWVKSDVVDGALPGQNGGPLRDEAQQALLARRGWPARGRCEPRRSTGSRDRRRCGEASSCRNRTGRPARRTPRRRPRGPSGPARACLPKRAGDAPDRDRQHGIRRCPIRPRRDARQVARADVVAARRPVSA